MRQRLEQLRAELRKGERELALLDERRRELRDTLLRISGAVQVLEELLGQQGGNPGNGQAQPPRATAPAEAPRALGVP